MTTEVAGLMTTSSGTHGTFEKSMKRSMARSRSGCQYGWGSHMSTRMPA